MMFSRSLAITPIPREGFKKEIKKELEKTGYVDTDNVVKKKKGRPRKNECAEENRKEISNDETSIENKTDTKRKVRSNAGKNKKSK